MERVIKSFNLPDEICSIIYDYYKPPFLDEIQNPFNKYNLLRNDCLIRKKLPQGLDNCELRKQFLTKAFYYPNEYIVGDIQSQLLYSLWGRSYMAFGVREYDRDHLKKCCKINNIEYKERTQSKTLIRKLMKI